MSTKQVKLGVFLLLFLWGIHPSPATAAETTAPVYIRNQQIREAQGTYRETREEAVSERIETRDTDAYRETMREAREVRRASISGARYTFRTERARIHGERLARRFAFYEQRLTNIANRIATRIEKERSEGKDVSSAQSSLDAARTALATAVADGKKAVEMFTTITATTWDTQQPEIKAAIEQAQLARKGFAQSHKFLADSIRALATN